MKKIIFFLLFVNFCFSQEKELTISQIDSIVKTSKNKIQSSGVIKKDKKTIGGFYLTEISFNNKLIYSSYSENINDKENSFDYYYEFYFSNENPILVTVSITKTNRKTKIKERFETKLNENNLYSFKEIENPFSFELRKKLNLVLIEFLNNKKTE
jgi:hypothetical protein